MSPMRLASPVMLLVAHGTDNPQGQATVEAIARRVRLRRPDVRVELAYVDVQQPRVAQVVRRLVHAELASVVVVPLLLSLGHHVQVDIAAAIGDSPYAVSTGPLGPDPVLACIMADRVVAAGGQVGDSLIVAAAGSSRPEATADVEMAAQSLRRCWPGAVGVAHGRAASPSVPEAVARLRAAGARRVVIAPYLIGEGVFSDRLADAGADLVARPLGSDPKLISLIGSRYDLGVSRLRNRSTGLRHATAAEPMHAAR